MSQSPASNERFNILFESVRLGPVVAPNRFYQVPHCTGMGYNLPNTLAAMRGVKAEGGWGVVNTEYCSIHPTSDDMPFPHCSLWDKNDIKRMALITNQVHFHGSLAGVELWHGGMRSSNLNTRKIPIGPVSLPTSNEPFQCQAMDRQDIKNFRQWHRKAARRAKEAGFDIVYVYATHTYLLDQFLDPAVNTRNDEYGGKEENRHRLIREILEETAEEVGSTCAIAVRIAVEDSHTKKGASNSLLQSLAHYCDLFDVTIPNYEIEMGVSRHVNEGALEPAIKHVRELTKKPVVSVGRFTSPETMLSQVRRGILDFVGAARPSIADPFLPNKIRDGNFDDIRECIGCNICYSGDGKSVPIRCTQNPTMGEEWRRGWHPENIPVAQQTSEILVVGGGPAGLEASATLVRRGHRVILAEATSALGGRVKLESTLPGLSEWIRVRDHRTQLLSQHHLASIHLKSLMTVSDIIETGCKHVILATGSKWRTDGRGRNSPAVVDGIGDALVLTPDKLMAGTRADTNHYLIYDDDNYYIGSAVAILLAKEGYKVTYVTPDSIVSSWSRYTTEQWAVQAELINLGVEIVTEQYLLKVQEKSAVLSCIYTDRRTEIPYECLVPVTSREPVDSLWHELNSDSEHYDTILRIGDCRAPGIIAGAIYDGHKAGREFGMLGHSLIPKRDVIEANDLN